MLCICYSKQIIPSLGNWVSSGLVYLVYSRHHHRNPYLIPFSKVASGLWFTKNSLPIQSPLPDMWSLSFQPLTTLKLHLSSKSGGLNKLPLIKRRLKVPLIRTQDRQKIWGKNWMFFLSARQAQMLLIWRQTVKRKFSIELYNWSLKLY